MDYTYEQLRHKTVGELREIAKGNEHEALMIVRRGVDQMTDDLFWRPLAGLARSAALLRRNGEQ